MFKYISIYYISGRKKDFFSLSIKAWNKRQDDSFYLDSFLQDWVDERELLVQLEAHVQALAFSSQLKQK